MLAYVCKRKHLKRERRTRSCSELHPNPPPLHQHPGHLALISQLLHIQFLFQAPAFLWLEYVFLHPTGANMLLFPLS